MRVENWKLRVMITFKAFSFLLKHKQQAYHNFQFSTLNSQLSTLNSQPGWHNICIFNRSKLLAECATKSFAQNSRVLSAFGYFVYNQWVMRFFVETEEFSSRKIPPFLLKCSPFALQLYSICIATVFLLHSNCTSFAIQRSLKWRIGWCRML